MQARVLNFWSELIKTQNIDKILIITHAGVIRLVIQSILQFPLENMFNIRIDYGKKGIVKLEGEVFSIHTINV